MKSKLNTPIHRLNKLTLLGTTALFANFAIMPMAYAQDSSDTAVNEDEIVTTGIRQALKDARDLKRNADTAVDSITASDVATLPDLSVAEALSRVPGVVSQRFDLSDNNNGDFPSSEGGGNLIRGLTLVRSELNGRDVFSANGGRALDFGTVPPELIGAVDVYKNNTADIIEGGIGGTINLRTLEPFDRPGRVATVSVDGTYTDLREEFAPDVSVVLGDRWSGDYGEFGLLGSFSHSELKTRTDNFQIGQLVPTFFDGGNIALPGGFQARTNDRDRERQSYYLAGQWQNSEGTLKATAKYARIENTVGSDERTLESFVNGESAFAIQLPGSIALTTFNATGLATCNSQGGGGLGACEPTQDVSRLYQSGLISNGNRDWTGSSGAEITTLGIHIDERVSTDDISLNVQWRPSDRWYVNLDAHRTTSDFERDRLWSVTTFFSDYLLNADINDPSVELVLDPNNRPPRRFADGTSTGNAFDGGNVADLITNPSISNPDALFPWAAADQFERNEGDLFALRGDVEYEFENDGWFDSVQFGARYSEREQINRNTNLNWAQIAPPWDGGTNVPITETSLGFELFDYADFLRGGAVVGDNTTVVFTDRAVLQDYDAFVAAITGDTSSGLINPVWQPLLVDGEVQFALSRAGGDTRPASAIGDVTEEVLNLYGRFNFGNEFDNGTALSGNIGLRYVKSDATGVGEFNFVEIQQGDLSDPNNVDIEPFIPEAFEFLRQASVDTSGPLRSDEFFLPSFNAKWEFNDESLMRFGVSKNITRPNISQLNPNQTAFINPTRIFTEDSATGTRTITDAIASQVGVGGGNPNLKPVESWNFDLSFEHYFGDENFFSIAGFHKEISNNIINGTFIQGSVELDGDQVPIVFNGDVNEGEGEITGVELAYQHFFTGLPGLWSNLGVQANYTYIDAEVSPGLAFIDANNDGVADSPDTLFRFDTGNFLGLSDHAVNVIGIYQDERFEFRLAYNWRSEFLSSRRDFITGNPIFQEDAGFLDGSFKWEVNDNLQFRIQASNILATNQKATQQINALDQRFGRATIEFDRRIRFGLRYNF